MELQSTPISEDIIAPNYQRSLSWDQKTQLKHICQNLIHKSSDIFRKEIDKIVERKIEYYTDFIYDNADYLGNPITRYFDAYKIYNEFNSKYNYHEIFSLKGKLTGKRRKYEKYKEDVKIAKKSAVRAFQVVFGEKFNEHDTCKDLRSTIKYAILNLTNIKSQYDHLLHINHNVLKFVIENYINTNPFETDLIRLTLHIVREYYNHISAINKIPSPIAEEIIIKIFRNENKGKIES